MSSKIDTAMKVIGGLIVAVFFLPFFSITCNGVEVANVTGFTLVKGGEPGGMAAEGGKKLAREAGEDGAKKDSGDPVKPNAFAIAAFAIAIIGFGVSFVKARQARIANMALAGLGLAALIALWVDVTGKADELDPSKKKKANSAEVKKDDPDEKLAREITRDIEREVKIEIGSTIGFWAASILFITVGILGFKRLKAGPDSPGAIGGMGSGAPPHEPMGPPGGAPPGAYPPTNGQPPNA